MKRGQDPQSQEDDLVGQRQAAAAWDKRACQVLVRVNEASNPAVRSACVEALRDLGSSRFVPNPLTRGELWRAMTQCQFVASPPGQGPDCHRTWEALALGAVPIIKRVPALSPMFAELPVWEVDDYKEVTEGALAEMSLRIGGRLESGDYDFSRMTVGWWRDHVRATSARLTASSPAS